MTLSILSFRAFCFSSVVGISCWSWYIWIYLDRNTFINFDFLKFKLKELKKLSLKRLPIVSFFMLLALELTTEVSWFFFLSKGNEFNLIILKKNLAMERIYECIEIYLVITSLEKDLEMMKDPLFC